MKSFRLQACKEDGTMETQVVELTWDTVNRWESDDESMAFCFQYSRNDKPARWVKVFTPYVSTYIRYIRRRIYYAITAIVLIATLNLHTFSMTILTQYFFLFALTLQHAYLADCFDRIMEERKWNDSGD